MHSNVTGVLIQGGKI